MSHVLTATIVEIEAPAAPWRADRVTRMIAALVGPLFMVSGLFVLANRGAILAVAQAFAANPSLLVLAGYLTFMPGMIIVVFHNRWHGGLPVLVTGIGWLFVVAGLARIMLAYQLAPAMLSAIPALMPAMPLIGVAMLTLGAVLTFAGWRR